MHPLSKPNKYIYICVSFFIYCGCIFAFSLELSVDTNVLGKKLGIVVSHSKKRATFKEMYF